MSRAHYGSDFYALYDGDAGSSAEQVVPLIMEWFRPQSVVDFGCGLGTWLAEFHRQGVAQVRGLDGPYVDQRMLRIAPHDFQACDLTRLADNLGRFDLAMSLEVAEHLPAAAAVEFVGSLTRHADVVLFSAAIPHQGGIHHVNEQWPDYWTRLFADRGFKAWDGLRPRLWTNPRVAPWYAQNLLLFINESARPRYAHLPAASAEPPRWVHPGMWALANDLPNRSCKQLLAALFPSLFQALRWRWEGWRARGKLCHKP